VETAGRSIQIEILHSRGCANTLPTAELLKDIAKDLQISIDIVMVVVDTEEQANRLRFLGSPTVRIDGADIEPSAQDALAFGLT
jgi:hypothetical protein